MELMRTNAVFSRIALASCFCAEIKVLGKIWKNSRNSYFPEDSRSQEGSCRRGPQPPDATWPRSRLDRAWGPPGHSVAGSATPFGLFIHPDLKREGDRSYFPEEFQSAAASAKPISGSRSSCSGILSGRGLKERSSPSPSPPPLHRPSMFPPSMCE